MKNLFKKQKQELDFGNLSAILSSGVAAGMAIAKYAGKNSKTGGIIGVGFSLLVTGLIVALDDEPTNDRNNNI